MKNREKFAGRRREHHPMVSIGLFFIVLGLALLAATNDVLNLGDWKRYFTWEVALIFVGVLLLVNLNFVGGILAVAGGIWFLLENLFVVIPPIVKTMYWPGVIILLGISFIISSIVKRKKEIN